MEKATQSPSRGGEAQPIKASKVILRCGSEFFGGKRRDNGRLDVPGGKAKGGETPLDCALRETLEEIVVNDANCRDWLECRLRESKTRMVCYVAGHEIYHITLFHVQCRYSDVLGLTEDGMCEMEEPGWREIEALLREKRDRTRETASGSRYAAAIQELLADNRKRGGEATPVASKAGYCDTMRRLKRKIGVQGEPKAGDRMKDGPPWDTSLSRAMPGQVGTDAEPPRLGSVDIGSRSRKGTPCHREGEAPRKAWPGKPKHSSRAGIPKTGVATGETSQKGKGNGAGTMASMSASSAWAIREGEVESGGLEEHQPTGSLDRHATGELNLTPRLKRRQHVAALGRDTHSPAQELVRKDENESDEEEMTEIRAMRMRHSFNFLT